MFRGAICKLATTEPPMPSKTASQVGPIEEWLHGCTSDWSQVADGYKVRLPARLAERCLTLVSRQSVSLLEPKARRCTSHRPLPCEPRRARAAGTLGDWVPHVGSRLKGLSPVHMGLCGHPAVAE
mmetsp:Transcript_131303/g.420109  ORF Transcript_131303/g.420109 Transcript_131303/m.420109 type:complete len:125 (+) Transcript_131303:190-564(+)